MEIISERFGGAEEDRTPGLRIANAALSQLSYSPKFKQCAAKTKNQVFRPWRIDPAIHP